MKAVDIPAKFPIPFAKNAGGSYIRSVPTSSQIGVQDGAASLNDGFPPLNFQPIASGGVPPFGQDMNGILFQSTSWDQWVGAGGAVKYDAAFSASIGGYPAGSIIASATLGWFWYNLVDDNASNPDTGGANWIGFTPCNLYAVDSGAVNAIAVTFSPVPATLAVLTGVPLRIKKISSANTGATTLNPNGLGATAIVNPDGTALVGGELPANGVLTVIYDGSQFQLQSVSGITVTPAQLQQQTGNAAVDSGTANLIIINLNPVPANLAALDKVPIRIKKVAAVNTGAVLINANSFGGQAFTHADGSALAAGEIPGNGLIEVAWDNAAARFTLLSITKAPPLPASIADMEAGTSTTLAATPGTMPYSDNAIKGYVIFKWTGAAITITDKSAIINTVSRNSAGNYTITTQGGLTFTHGFAIATGRGPNPATAGSIGMGSHFTGTNPSVSVYFGDAGGSGGQASDPLSEVGVILIGHTNN